MDLAESRSVKKIDSDESESSSEVLNQEIISVLDRTQKYHSATFEEFKSDLLKYAVKVSKLVEENKKLENLLEVEKIAKQEAENEREEAREHLCKYTETFMREFSLAKSYWEGIESQLKEGTEYIQKQVKELEVQNKQLDIELHEAKNKIKIMARNGEIMKEENLIMKSKGEALQVEIESKKLELTKVAEELHSSKMHTIKGGVIKETLVEENRRLKREFSQKCNELEVMKNEKDQLTRRIDDLIQNTLKNKAIEGEIKEIKFYLNILGKGNSTLNNKIQHLLSNVNKDSSSIGIQTDLTNHLLSEYENLDRDATVLVIKMKEELISTKDDMVALKQENETLKNFIRDIKREKELKDEEERVEKLEETVKTLSEIIQQDQQKPASKEDMIIKKLMEVKRDLDILKGNSKGDFTEFQIQPTSVPIKLTSFKNSRR